MDLNSSAVSHCRTLMFAVARAGLPSGQVATDGNGLESRAGCCNAAWSPTEAEGKNATNESHRAEKALPVLIDSIGMTLEVRCHALGVSKQEERHAVTVALEAVPVGKETGNELFSLAKLDLVIRHGSESFERGLVDSSITKSINGPPRRRVGLLPYSQPCCQC